MPDPGKIALWIAQLTDSNPEDRAAAACNLRRAAFEHCFSGCNAWIRDLEFGQFLRAMTASIPGKSHSESLPFVAGIAVQPQNFERIRRANGSPRLADVPPDQDAMEFELHFPDGGIDILTAREPGGSGAIARYLEKFGEGIQQIEINVTDVDRATDLLRDKFGLAPIYPGTRAGADGTRVNFFLAPAADGKKCLIELVQDPSTR